MKGYYIPNQKLACFVLRLNIINTQKVIIIIIYINKFAMSVCACVCLAMRSAVLRPTELKLGTGVGFGELGGTVNFSSRPDRSKVI